MLLIEGGKAVSIRFLSIVLTLILFLQGCTTQTYEPIERDVPILGVVNLKEHSLSFINHITKQPLAKWSMDEPFTKVQLLPDHDTLLLYGQEMEHISVYKLSSGKKIADWPVTKGIAHIALSHDNNHLLLVNEKNATISIMTLKGKIVDEIHVPPSPFSIVEDVNHKRWIVIHFKGGIISVIDQKTKKVIQTINTFESAVSGLVVTKTNELWVGGHGGGETMQQDVYIYSLNNGQLLEKVRTETMPIQLLQMNDFIYVLSHGTNMLYKIEPVSKKRVRSIEIGANPFAMIKTDQEIVVASYDSSEIIYVDPTALTMKQKIKVGKGPFYLFFRPAEGKR
jgi:DNA-binding beta-propeller fold protein YncE